MTATSEMPVPTFLRRDDDGVQPIIRHRHHADSRIGFYATREARDALFHALSCRNESFVGFRGDLWRSWREGMREEAMKFRKLSGARRQTVLRA